jgi:hypothetical protein
MIIFIWQGFGFIVPVVSFGMLIGVELLSEWLSGSSVYYQDH